MSLAQVTNAGVAALDALPNLKRITVSRCARICESGMQVQTPALILGKFAAFKHRSG